MEFDLSIANREKVRHFRKELEQMRFDEQRKHDALEEIKARQKDLMERIHIIPEPSIKDDQHLREMKQVCRELRDLESRDGLIIEEQHYLDERLKDLQEQEKILKESLATGGAKRPFWLGLGLWGIIILFLVGFGMQTKMGWPFLAAVMTFFLGLAVWIISVLIIKTRLKRGAVKDTQIQALSAKIEDLEKRQSEIRYTLNHHQEQRQALSDLLSLKGRPSIATLDGMEQDLTDQMARLTRWQDSMRDLDQIEKRLSEMQTALQQAETQADQVRDSWQTWLRDHDLDTTLSPDGVLETFTLIESCKEQIRGLEQLQSKIESLDVIKEKYLTLAEPLFGLYTMTPKTDSEIQIAVQALIQTFTESEKAAQKRELLLREVQASQETVDRYAGQIQSLRQKIRDLMASGGAEDDDAFRKRALIFEDRITLKKDIERYEDNIKRLSSNWGGMQGVIEELLTYDIRELETQRMTIEEELSETETALEQSKQELARLDERMIQLVQDERVSLLRKEEEELKEELSILTEEWTTIRLAQTLIKMARTRYEKERQPKVISEAGHFFKQLTRGRYASLIAPLGEDRIEVLSQDGSRKEIAQLSRGTAEQLYLSLRFGFINEFSKRSGALPIIMDEILVNFDNHRAEATVKSIVELSQTHQILYFTCHPTTAGLFKKIAPDTPIIEIVHGHLKEAGS
jgi:uncharacterized protein YhaN